MVLNGHSAGGGRGQNSYTVMWNIGRTLSANAENPWRKHYRDRKWIATKERTKSLGALTDRFT